MSFGSSGVGFIVWGFKGEGGGWDFGGGFWGFEGLSGVTEGLKGGLVSTDGKVGVMSINLKLCLSYVQIPENLRPLYHSSVSP